MKIVLALALGLALGYAASLAAQVTWGVGQTNLHIVPLAANCLYVLEGPTQGALAVVPRTSLGCQ